MQGLCAVSSQCWCPDRTRTPGRTRSKRLTAEPSQAATGHRSVTTRGKKKEKHRPCKKKMAPMFKAVRARTVAAENAFSLSPVSQDVDMVSQFPLSGFRRPRSFNCVSFFQSKLFQKHTRIACCEQQHLEITCLIPITWRVILTFAPVLCSSGSDISRGNVHKSYMSHHVQTR